MHLWFLHPLIPSLDELATHPACPNRHGAFLPWAPSSLFVPPKSCRHCFQTTGDMLWLCVEAHQLWNHLKNDGIFGWEDSPVNRLNVPMNRWFSFASLPSSRISCKNYRLLRIIWDARFDVYIQGNVLISWEVSMGPEFYNSTRYRSQHELDLIRSNLHNALQLLCRHQFHHEYYPKVLPLSIVVLGCQTSSLPENNLVQTNVGVVYRWMHGIHIQYL